MWPTMRAMANPFSGPSSAAYRPFCHLGSWVMALRPTALKAMAWVERRAAEAMQMAERTISG